MTRKSCAVGMRNALLRNHLKSKQDVVLAIVLFVLSVLFFFVIERSVLIVLLFFLQRYADPHGEERKGNKTSVKLKQVQYICPIFRFEKQTFHGG